MESSGHFRPLRLGPARLINFLPPTLASAYLNPPALTHKYAPLSRRITLNILLGLIRQCYPFSFLTTWGEAHCTAAADNVASEREHRHSQAEAAAAFAGEDGPNTIPRWRYHCSLPRRVLQVCTRMLTHLNHMQYISCQYPDALAQTRRCRCRHIIREEHIRLYSAVRHKALHSANVFETQATHLNQVRE
jgi:hypothetical protein